MSPTETAWRAALKRLQRAIEEKDPNAARHRENEAAAWAEYRREMKTKAAELAQREAR